MTHDLDSDTLEASAKPLDVTMNFADGTEASIQLVVTADGAIGVIANTNDITSEEQFDVWPYRMQYLCVVNGAATYYAEINGIDRSTLRVIGMFDADQWTP